MRYEGRHQIAKRLCALMFHLPQQRTLTPDVVERLASWLSVSTRTVYRDLEALREAGFKVPPFEKSEAA